MSRNQQCEVQKIKIFNYCIYYVCIGRQKHVSQGKCWKEGLRKYWDKCIPVIGCMLAIFNTFVKVLLWLLGLCKLYACILKWVSELVVKPWYIVVITVCVCHWGTHHIWWQSYFPVRHKVVEDVSCWGITSFRHQTGSHEVTQVSSSVSAFTISRLLCHCLCWRKAFSFWGHQLNFVPFLVKETFWFKTRVIGIEKQKVVYKAKITVISPNRYLIERFSVLPLKCLLLQYKTGIIFASKLEVTLL